MDSDALNTFLTVHRRGGISSAAKALHRSQPAISRRIALLEQDRRPAVRADRGADHAERRRAGDGALCRVAVRLLRTRRMRSALWRGRIRGRSHSRWWARLPAAGSPRSSKTLRGRSSLGRISACATALSGDVRDLIPRGEATIGLRYDRNRSRYLDCDLQFAEPLEVVCASDHPRAGRRIAKLADLREERWIAFPVVPGGARSRPRMCSRCSDPRIGRRRLDAGRQPTAQKRLVEAGLGIALLSESHAAEELTHATISTIRVRDLRPARTS